MNLPIRARLTLWSVAMLALTLLLFAAGVLAFVRREQRVAVDRALRERAAEFATAFAAEWAEEPGDKAAQEAANTLARAVARAVYEATALPFPGALPSWKERFG